MSKIGNIGLQDTLNLARKVLLGIVLLFAGAVVAHQISGFWNVTGPVPPEQIASTLNSTNFPSLFPTPTIVKHVCASGCDYNGNNGLASALAAVSSDAPNCGELITVDNINDGYSETFSNPTSAPIVFSYACPTGKEVLVETVTPNSINPQGTKLTRSNITTYNPFMAQINISCAVSTCKFIAPISISDGADGLIIDGMECSASGTAVSGCINYGSGTNTSGFANHMWLMRSYLHGPSNYSTLIHNWISDDAEFISVTDSLLDFGIETLSDGGSTYTESHSFFDAYTPGPISLINNTFYGCMTEQIFFGGTLSPSTALNPTDIEVFKNSIGNDFNNTTCRTNGSIKNWFELKKGVRVRIAANEFKYSWASLANGGQQFGTGIDNNVASSVSGAGATENANDFGAEVADVDFDSNDLQHLAEFYNIQGSSVNSEATQWAITKRVRVYNNLVHDFGLGWSVFQDATVNGCQTATAAATTGTGSLIFNIANTQQFGNGDLIVATGFVAPTFNFNVYLSKIVSHVTNTSITLSFPDSGTIQSATTLGQVCVSQSNAAHAGIGISPGAVYWAPNPSSTGLVATAAVITSGSSVPGFTNTETITFAALQSGAMSVNAGGFGYAVNDIVGVTQVGASGGELKIIAVSGGAVTNFQIVTGQNGTGYTTATGLATSDISSSGTGFTVNISTDPASSTNGTTTGGFFVGCNVRTTGFSPSGFNAALGGAHGPLSYVSQVLNGPTNTISFPTNSATGTATGEGTAFCQTPLPGPIYVAVLNNGLYGSLAPAGANVAQSAFVVSGTGGANGETLFTFNNQAGVGGGSSANGVFLFFNIAGNVEVGDQDVMSTTGTQTIIQMANAGGFGLNPTAGGSATLVANTNVAVDPSNNFFANWPTSGAASTPGTSIAGVTTNPTGTWTSTLGIVNYSTCAAGDLNLGTLTSMISCELTSGSFTADGPNIPLIQTLMALPNDTTYWGPRKSW